MLVSHGLQVMPTYMLVTWTSATCFPLDWSSILRSLTQKWATRRYTHLIVKLPWAKYCQLSILLILNIATRTCLSVASFTSLKCSLRPGKVPVTSKMGEWARLVHWSLPSSAQYWDWWRTRPPCRGWSYPSNGLLSDCPWHIQQCCSDQHCRCHTWHCEAISVLIWSDNKRLCWHRQEWWGTLWQTWWLLDYI